MLFRVLVGCLFICSCASNRMMQTELYFAQVTYEGKPVTDSEWQAFTKNEIARVFINGSTTYRTIGTWYDPEQKKLVTEPSYVVSYFYKKSSAISRQIDSLRHHYKIAFHQQSVLRVDRKVSFHF